MHFIVTVCVVLRRWRCTRRFELRLLRVWPAQLLLLALACIGISCVICKRLEAWRGALRRLARAQARPLAAPLAAHTPFCLLATGPLGS